MERPKDIADLMANWKQMCDLMEFAQAWKNGEFIAPNGQRIPVMWEPGSKNALIDGRALTATGEQVFPVMPSQIGNGGKVLQTNGSVMSWFSLAGAKLSLTSDEPVTSGGSGEFLAWDQADYDYASYFSGSSPTRLTIATTGVYQVRCSIAWETNSTGERYAYILVNGVDVIASAARQALTAGTTVVETITDAILTAGDYVEVQAYQNSGTTLNVLAPTVDDFRTNFSISRMR